MRDPRESAARWRPSIARRSSRPAAGPPGRGPESTVFRNAPPERSLKPRPAQAAARTRRATSLTFSNGPVEFGAGRPKARQGLLILLIGFGSTRLFLQPH